MCTLPVVAAVLEVAAPFAPLPGAGVTEGAADLLLRARRLRLSLDSVARPDAMAAGSVQVRHVEGADHFSFMHVRPPRTTEPLTGRDAFLAELTRDVCDFVTG